MAGGIRSYEMARRLVTCGHEVNMVTTWRENERHSGWFTTNENGIQVHWLPNSYSNKLGFWARIYAFLRFSVYASSYASKLKVDVIFATSTPLTIAIPAIFLSKKLRVPMVFEVRDLWPDVPIALSVLKNPLLVYLAKRLEQLAYKNATRIVALAPGMKEAIIAKGVDDEIIDVIPNGADLDIFSASYDEGAYNELSSNHDLILNKKILLYAGALGVVNNVDYIIDLAARIKDISPDDPYVFIILGGGKNEEMLKTLATKLGVIDLNVKFIGRVTKVEVAKWYSICTATFMTYEGPELVYRDSVSNKFFDSLAAGKPVISNFAGFSSLIAQEHGAGKILSRDIDKGAFEFVEYLSDDEQIRSAGKAARALAENVFSRDRLASQLEETLVSVTHTIS